ncbi:MAG: hypothetical protein QMD21_07125 [Candidatus Thermoplasmatota archaeon]|nr:hypothetical protein [Candidatus Thermoplasmatota archaeon]MDI6856532.1 hypothetical protein [Candidatus Thermoplasmatota archaeon]
MTTKEKLKKAGWEKQFIACEPRLSEAVELYKSLGFEVRLEPLALEEMDEDCKICYEAEPDKYKTIYTRKKKE